MQMKVFAFSNPMLTKFCSQKYNIKTGCNTVRLGTLYDYRTIENELLRDKGEGTFSYFLNFPTHLEASPEWLSSFELGGEGSVSIDNLRIVNNKIKVKKLSLSGSTHNCWIYCLSKGVDSAGNITDAHEDKWTIEGDKIADFANYLASVLWADLSYHDLPPELTSKYGIQDIQRRLHMSVEVKEVEYVDRHVVIAGTDHMQISEIEALRDMVAFIKPKEFKHEQEVRIAIWLTFDGKKISIVDRPKFLSIRPIDKLF
ncbi:hypothetical protein C4J95_1594 [Pseudomonas orientalis]|nr:hypothetical protein C4J95_1594 [Pseudomonas orientalis]